MRTSLIFAYILSSSITSAFVMQQPGINIRPTPKNEGQMLSSTPTADDLSSVKGIIFDIDGTIADSGKLGYDATVVVLENNGCPTITEEIYHEHTIYTTPERLARHAGLVPGDVDFEAIGQKLGAEFDDFYVKLVDTKTAGFYPGIDDFLNNIPSDVKIGALTNACVAYAHAVLTVNCPVAAGISGGLPESGGIYDRFGSIHGADDSPKPKPYPDGLYVICKELGLKPEECVYIGDSPSDGKAADAAGMASIGVLWGSHTEEKVRNAPFNYVCNTVEEMQALLPRNK
mmetsp:Transcript_8705/g.12311  ORF Transcript_8705/g.12311 Transcript_8705/m.12311 type:complete len:287 (-) Transcript_8705:72-932(-)